MFQITIQNSQRRITGCTAGCNTNAEIPQYHNNSKCQKVANNGLVTVKDISHSHMFPCII